MLLTLIAIHFVVDYQFQSEFIAVNKNRHLNKTPVPWYYVMASHAACHALPVGWLLASPWLATAEFAAHYIIDVIKCEGKTNIHTDQALHILCKLAWVCVLAYS